MRERRASPPSLRRATLAVAASLLCALVVLGGRTAPAASRDDVPVATILAAYAHAMHSDDVATFVADGTLAGDGLTGTFHLARANGNEREDDVIGPEHQTSLRLGDRVYVRDANGNVRELRGFLYRQALTEEFIGSGAFAAHPANARFVGWGKFGHTRAWRLEVRADGGEPETLWIDPDSGLPLQLEYIDGDGSSFVRYSDWRTIDGHVLAFRSVQSDGDPRFDTVQQTTSVTIDRPVDATTFAPLTPRALIKGPVQTVPLIERNGHVGVTVRVAGRDWFFLLDTGAQGIVVDTSVVALAGILPEGRLEVLGATRSGGLGLATLPSIEIGSSSIDGLAVSVLDLGASSMGRLHADGILGYPFFASALVELDFAKHVMRFGPPGSFVPRGERIELDVDRELAEASLAANGVTAPFIIDTGNSGEMFLYQPFVDAHASLVPVSTSASVTYGLGGTNKTYMTTLDVLDVGSVPLYHRAVDVILATKGAFADRVDAGNVGLGVLRNFVTTFDFANRAMYVAPGDDFDDRRWATVFNR
jgi:hypothetical protein